MKDRPWFDHYEKCVPHEIDDSQFHSLPNLFDDTLKKYASKVAFTNMSASLTFSQLDKLSANFAAFLLEDLGLKKGD